jgi:hypothetical protein
LSKDQFEGASNAVIAALYVEPDGCYAGLRGVDAWCEARDARLYAGPHPVVAHPPCQRWGRMAHGGPSAPGTKTPGDDGGCFAAALDALGEFGGVLEHPCDSKAWKHFEIAKPSRHAGWIWSPKPKTQRWREDGEWWTCYVEQGHYGHMSRKPTWLLTQGLTLSQLPQLNWSRGEQRLHPIALARYGYEKARRIGMTAMIGGKDKTKIRNATPTEFRDVLLSIARTARPVALAA